MEFKALKNIESSFRQIRLYVEKTVKVTPKKRRKMTPKS